MLPVEAEDRPAEAVLEVVAVRLCLTVPLEEPALDLAAIVLTGALAVPEPTLVELAD